MCITVCPKLSHVYYCMSKPKPCVLPVSQVSPISKCCHAAKHSMKHCMEKCWKRIRVWTHNRHPTPHPYGWSVGCLLWVFWEKLLHKVLVICITIMVIPLFYSYICTSILNVADAIFQYFSTMSIFVPVGLLKGRSSKKLHLFKMILCIFVEIFGVTNIVRLHVYWYPLI